MRVKTASISAIVVIVLVVWLIGTLATWGIINAAILWLLPHFGVTFSTITFWQAAIVGLVIGLIETFFSRG